MEIRKVNIIVPVYNEEKYLTGFINDLMTEIKSQSVIKKIIFVNDGSIDQTQKIIEKFANKFPNITLINHPTNSGKGEAMRTGLELAKKQDVDAVVFMDGDNQHHPKHLNSFIKKLEDNPIVFGYRHLSKDAPWIRRTGNKIAGIIIHNLFKIKRKDLLCGFMAVRRDTYDSIQWNSSGYGVEAEISAIVGRKRIPFGEVFVSTIYLDKNKGVTLWHAFKILLNLPRWYFQVR